MWNDGRADECTCLENRRPTRLGGSNPSRSAKRLSRYNHGTVNASVSYSRRGARVAERGALLRRCPGKPDRGFKSLPLRHRMRKLCAIALVASACVVSSFATPGASPVSAAACTQFHSAKPNDSWSRVAARFNVRLRELLSMNGTTSNTAIFVGDKICVSLQPVIRPPVEKFTRQQVITIIREVWPDDLEETALFLARRESNYVYSVVGGTNNCCLGLFQMYWSVHQSWLSKSGITEPSQLLDPRTNAEAALALYRRNGKSWRPWWTSSWRP